MGKLLDQDLKARAAEVMPGGVYGHLSTARLPPSYPQFFTKAKGAHLWGTDGQKYLDFMCAFGPNLLFKTGSRPVKRQGVHASDRGDPARMRAIPNNAILQQFGYIANVVAGLGAGVGADRDRFAKLARSSPRLQTILKMIAHGKVLVNGKRVDIRSAILEVGDTVVKEWTEKAGAEGQAILDAFKAAK